MAGCDWLMDLPATDSAHQSRGAGLGLLDRSHCSATIVHMETQLVRQVYRCVILSDRQVYVTVTQTDRCIELSDRQVTGESQTDRGTILTHRQTGESDRHVRVRQTGVSY